MRISNSRLTLALTLALTGTAGYAVQASAQSLPGTPPPPNEPGCYRFNGGWQRSECDSPEYINKHIPHPEILAGIGETTVKSKTPDPFLSSSVQVDLSQLGSEEDIDPSTGLPERGPDAYSIQANVFFNGDNGDNDGLQFTNQVEPLAAAPGVLMNHVCVWQVDVDTQKYDSTCISIAFGVVFNEVKGIDLGKGNLATVSFLGGALTAAVVAPDRYHLANSHRWNNISGGLLGYGNSSRAAFSGKEGLSVTKIGASTCLNEDVLGQWVTENPCSQSEKLDGRAVAIVSPSAATNGDATGETTSLVPVTGNPISSLPEISFPNDWAVEMEYASTPTGKCPGSTKPPLCKS
jgi:hypothetical protein